MPAAHAPLHEADDKPVTAPYLPALHAVQADWPARENLPTAHGAQFEFFDDGEKVPGEQTSHFVAPAAAPVLVMDPAGQCSQKALPGSPWCRPGAHAGQEKRLDFGWAVPALHAEHVCPAAPDLYWPG